MLPEKIDDTCLDVIEGFVVLSYDPTSSLGNVDEVRQELFSRKEDPLTKSLLLKHPYYNMLRELSSKVVLYRTRPCLSSPDCRVHLEGDGNLKIIAGCLTGRHSRKPWTLAISSSNVAVKLVVKDAVCEEASLTCTGLCNSGGNCN